MRCVCKPALMVLALSLAAMVAMAGHDASWHVDLHAASGAVSKSPAHRVAAVSTAMHKAGGAFKAAVQQAVGDGPLSGPCQTLALQLISSNCFNAIPSSSSAPNASEVSAMCGSCFAPIQAFVSQCMPHQSFVAEMMNLLCDTVDGTFCGILLADASGCQPTLNATKCAAQAQCRVNPSDATCETRPSVVCHPCFQNFFRFITQLSPGDVTSTLLDDFTCYRANGEYCIDVITGFNKNAVQPSLNASLESSICSDLTQRMCWSKLSVAVARYQEHVANAAYATCISLAVLPGAAQKCVDTWRWASFSAWTAAKATDVICRRNGGGQFCAEILVQPSSQFAACLTTASTAKTCSAQCDGLANASVTATGCCIGFLAELRTQVLPDVFAFMQPPGASPKGIRPTAPPAGVPANPWAPLSVCPSTANVSKVLNDTCPYSLSNFKAVRRVQLRIVWRYLAANATLRQLVADALQRDFMTAIGLTSADLAEFNVTEDPSLVLPLNATNSTTNSRSMAVQDAFASGVQVTIGVQTNDDGYTAGLTQSFESALAAQTVNLPTTQETLSSQCPQCAADPSGTLIIPPSPPTTDESSSHVGLAVGLAVGGVVLILLIGVVIFKVRRGRQDEAEYRKVGESDEMRRAI